MQIMKRSILLETSSSPRPQTIKRSMSYFELGYRKGDFPVTEKVADRILALPFHGHLVEAQIEFIVGTMKDASINVGAGAAIY